MTAQIADTFYYKGEEYSMIDLAGRGLIVPKDYGMKPEMMHTGCYRGFYSTYELTDTGLYLKEIVINTADQKYLPIDGVTPELIEGGRVAEYKDINIKTAFTGTIRLAKGFIHEFYTHMGYQEPYAFATVLDFTLKKGEVTELKDMSAEFAQVREEVRKQSMVERKKAGFFSRLFK